MNKYPKATNFIRSLVGITKPQLIQFDNNELYVVKFKKNPHQNIRGVHVLVNELIFSEFAQLLGFSNKKGQIVEVDQTFIDNTPELQDFESGLQFGSPYIANCKNFSSDNINLIKNRKDLVKVVILDTLFDNNDRNNENLLLEIERKERKENEFIFHMIDHSDILGGLDWNVNRLKELTEQEPHLYPFTISLIDLESSMDTFDPFLSKLEGLDKIAVASILGMIPDEWTLSNSESEAFIDLIYIRKRKIRQSIAKYFKQKQYEKSLKQFL